MKFACVVLALLVVSASANLTVRQQFEEFSQKYEKVYESDAHMLERFGIFQNNMAKVAKWNADPEDDAVYGVTKFSDLTFDEFQARYNKYVPQAESFGEENIPFYQAPANFTAPDAVDWRKKGVVTPVKDQGRCGSCWAFSATSEVESSMALAGKGLPILAPQQVVSCDTYDGGCNGGDLPSAFQYIQKARGIVKESQYPYTSGGNGRSGRCKAAGTPTGTIKSTSYATPPCNGGGCNSQDEDTLKTNIASYGPAAICVNANDKWQSYISGVVKSGCSGSYDSLDHCVQLVGYGVGYWLVRNSWNTDWGEDGYIYLQAGDNMCGVANEAMFTHS